MHSQQSNITPNIHSIKWNIQSRHAKFTYNIRTCTLNKRLFNANSHLGHSTFNSTFHSNTRLVNWNIQYEHSIGTLDSKIQHSIRDSFQTFNLNIQFEHAIPTFNSNIQSKHSIRTFNSNIHYHIWTNFMIVCMTTPFLMCISDFCKNSNTWAAPWKKVIEDIKQTGNA